MALNTIAFDESGNTGEDLLNNDQRAFVLASVNFNEKELIDLNNIFNFEGELHFKHLKNSEEGRKKLIKFLNHDLITTSKVHVCAAHKQYTVVGHVVDRLIEPFNHIKGVDIYQNGMNIIFTNVLYYSGNIIWGDEVFQDFLKKFMDMMRTKSSKAVEDFYKISELIYQGYAVKEKPLMKMILESRTIIDNVLGNLDKFSLDLTLSSFLVLVNNWYKLINSSFDVIHDDSKQIEFFQEYIDFVRSIEGEEQEVGYGSRKMIFPAQINSLKLVSSERYKSVQFADLIASSIGFYYNNTNSKHAKFRKEIFQSKLLNLNNAHLIWPAPNFTSESLDMVDTGDGQNILDFLASKS